MALEAGQLETLVHQIGEAVLATTETVETLSGQVDVLTQQVQQQGYQIFALSDAIQTLAENQDAAIARLDKLTAVLETLVSAIEVTDE
jgi:ABC-type transporter Mla subunit MlaD